MSKEKRRGFIGSYTSYAMLYFFSYFTLASFNAVLPVYLTGIGKQTSEMSFILSASSFFSLAIGPLAGYLCDRTQRPRLISGLLMVGMAGMSLLFGLSRETLSLFLLNGVLMSFLVATQPVSEQLASTGPYRYGVLRVWGTVGYSAGAQAAGIAVQSFPPMALFSMVATSALLTALGFGCIGKGTAPQPVREEKEGKPRPSLSIFLRQPQFLLYIAITFLVMGCSNINNAFLPLLLKDFGVPTGAVGTALSIGTLVEIPVILFSNKFMDRFSSKALLMATTLIFAVQYLCYGLAASVWAVAIPLVLLKAVATTLVMMLNLKVVRNLIPSELVTVGLSTVSACNALGSILMQNAGGVFADHFPIQTLYLVLAGMAGITLLMSMLLRVKDREKVFS